MNRLTSGLAIGTVALFAASGFALAQSASDAAASGSPAAAPTEGMTPDSSAPAPADQTSPADRPAQAGGMHNTSDMQSSGKKPCETTTTQPSSTDAAKAGTGCRKPK